MKLINKADANLNIALIAKNKAKSDAQKALMGRVLFMMDNMPTIEAIPKADYENRLKADIVAFLTDLRWEIDSLPTYNDVHDIADYIQEKINSLKE